MPLSNLPTGTVSTGDSGTRPRDGDTRTAADADRDVYVAELEHENAALRAELDRTADEDTSADTDYDRLVTSRDHGTTTGSDASVPDDSLRLRFARLVGLR